MPRFSFDLKNIAMGWKASMIIINKPDRRADEQLLRDIGFNNLVKIDDEPFEAVINPDEGKVYIGVYNDNILICTDNLPLAFFEEDESPVENKLIQLFPGSELCAIILHSVVNLWGYSVIINGKKVRARAGSSDDGTFVDMGERCRRKWNFLIPPS